MADLVPRKGDRAPDHAAGSRALISIDRHFEDCTPQEAATWAETRRLVVEQDEKRAIREYELMTRRMGMLARCGCSILASGAGIALAVYGFAFPGFMCLGAGLSMLAPEFIQTLAERLVGRVDNAE